MTKAHLIRWPGFLILAAALLAASPAPTPPERSDDPATVGSGDWPQWRGPNRDGVSAERGLLKQWPASGPEVLWRIQIGQGYSSVAVSDGRLYTLWDEGDGEFLVGLDAVTGKELWRHRVDSSFASDWGNGPRSTPVVDSGAVYAVSARGKLHAVSSDDGRAIWSHDLASEYGATVPSYGYASSPMVEGDKLLIEAGGPDDLAFIAFDKSSGEIIWASQTDQAAYSSPLAITVDGVRQIVFLSASGLFALAPENGSVLWQQSWNPTCPSTGIPTNVTHPIFIPPDKIFVSTGYGTLTGSAVFRILRKRETFSTETVWRSETMRNLINSSVLHDEHIYGFDKGILKAIDAETGEVLWKARGFERGSLITADDELIVLGEQGRLALVEATPSGFREKASAQILEGRSWTMPSLAHGRLYLRNQSEIVSLNLRGPGH